ncbi:MAG TPA: hypothetical protein VGD78_08495 [Chthoniobacterales bacterium]
MSRSETALHFGLKQRAAAWAYERGFRSLAFEVQAPRSAFRVDVAAYRAFRQTDAVFSPTSLVAVFECKQARSDLLRDNRRRARLQERLAELQDRRATLEKLLQVHHPHLRRGDSLFPDFETFDTELLQHDGYRLTVDKIARLQRQLRDGTKFDQMGRYQLADLHYLVTLPALVTVPEVPVGWGLLEAQPDGEVRELIPALKFNCPDRLRWLERIAKAATAAFLRYAVPVQTELGFR